jgi:alpha-L-rhamnosidase
MANKLIVWWLVMGVVAVNVLGSVSVGQLRSEDRSNPLGMDEPRPRLSWIIESDRRNEIQTSYQVLVASTAESLASDRGDLWDSGRVSSDESAQVEYAGQKLQSQTRCFWKVRIWDRDGNPSAWSQPASWSMGLLDPADWTAQWISDPVLADPANRPLTPIHCYRSELASRPDVVKWIVLNLGKARRMDAVDIIPARPEGQNSDFRTALFPLRFKVETADHQDFSDARLVVDQTASDFPNPRQNSCRFQFAALTNGYVRLTVTRLSCWDGQDFGVALGGLGVFDGSQPIATGAGVECSDSIESDRWSKSFLVARAPAVTLAEDAPALAAGMADTTAKFTVSRVPMLRREFNLASKVRRATLHVSARGFYEVRINGKRVGDELLAPGYTDYGTRLQYQTHDVTDLLRKGTNALGALLGYGWYAGHMNLFEMRCIYGYFPQFLAQLDVELTDGTRVCVGTDGQWRSTLDGPVRWSDLLDGEGYDCRREMPGWDQPGFDDHAWQPVWSQPRDGVPLVWPRCQPVRVISELPPVADQEVKPGVHVFDLGQEITGWCRLKVAGPAGTHVRLRHAELIAPDGNINVENLWGTPQEEDYILDGKGERTLEPHFTYHGFRYVELTGLPGKVKPGTLVGVNVRTAAAAAGQFECSNELYNRIQKTAFWTQANLLFDVPNGCAARAERLAWTGDIRPCVQSLLFNFDAAPLLTKYTADLRDDQLADGRFTDICPQAHLRGTTTCVGSPGWADAGVSLPWTAYVNTGNRRLLADHFESARRWVDVIYASNPDMLWRNNRGMDWGDWLSAGTPTPKEIGATAFFARSADLVSRMAQVLGRPAEAKHYQALFQGIRQAFVRQYVNPQGIIGGIAPGKPAIRDVTGIVRSLVKNERLALVVNNDVFGDPATNQRKTLHLVGRNGDKMLDLDFTEGVRVELSGPDGKPLEIISATYGYDGADPGDTQGSYALALQFGLLDEPLRSQAVRRLDELVARNGHHPTTGFWSSIELLLALSNSGCHADAAGMLNQRTEPSWGYMADNSTTLWEAFNANTQNLSLNHWTHSAISEWLWRNVAGLNPDEQHPGYQSFAIHPRPTREVSWCQASYNSLRGKIASHWQCVGNKFTLETTIPANTTATVFIPATGPGVVMESGKPAAESAGITLVRTDPGAVVYKLGSGVYHFASLTSLP